MNIRLNHLPEPTTAAFSLSALLERFAAPGLRRCAASNGCGSAERWAHSTMKCWHCDSEAKAICVFCGRGICAAHCKTMEHFVGYGKKAGNLLDMKGPPSTTAIRVRNACWCEACQIEYVKTN